MSTEITTIGVRLTTTGAAKAKRDISNVGRTADKVRGKVKLLATALVTVVAVKAIKDAIKYTASIEDLRIQLKFLTGSTKNASKAFKEMTKFASETPFSLREIQHSSASLLVAMGNDVDKLGDILQITGEISAQFGLPFQKSAEQLQRAMSSGISSADLFREKGVSAMLGFRTGVEHTAEETSKIINTWVKNNKGAIAELSDTFNGKVSMMGDAWDNLLLTFGEAGALDAAKDSLDNITALLRDPKTIKVVQDLGASILSTMQLLTGQKVTNESWLNASWWKKNVAGIVESTEQEKTAFKQLRNEFELLRLGGNQSIIIASKNITQPANKGEALKLEIRQWQSVAKITSKVFIITDKLTKKRTELEKITEAQISAEKILGTQFKNGKITLEQYTEGINSMKVEIQNYADVIKQIGLDKQMKRIAENMEDSITTAIMNMGDGLSAFKNLASSIFRDIAAEMIRSQISRPIASAASGFLGDVFGNMFGGGGASRGAPITDLRPPTFAGGGFTGSGARSGGTDGKGGFPAILHPNETVIDHAKGGKIGGDTITNISVTYSPQITAFDPRAASATIAENSGTVVGIIRQSAIRAGVNLGF